MYFFKITLLAYQCSMWGTAFFLFSWPTIPTNLKYRKRVLYCRWIGPWIKQINTDHIIKLSMLLCLTSLPLLLLWFLRIKKIKVSCFMARLLYALDPVTASRNRLLLMLSEYLDNKKVDIFQVFTPWCSCCHSSIEDSLQHSRYRSERLELASICGNSSFS